jgi:hypothetical protein
MACLGVHFALDEKEVHALKSQPTDAIRLEYLQDMEEAFFDDHPEWVVESDKAWDAIHRALTDGRIEWDNGSFPLSHVILGGERIYEPDDWIMTLKTSWEVQEIARALCEITDAQFRQGYSLIEARDYGFAVNEHDCEYTWSWFQRVRDLYYRAAKANRYVLFTASQ